MYDYFEEKHCVQSMDGTQLFVFIGGVGMILVHGSFGGHAAWKVLLAG